MAKENFIVEIYNFDTKNLIYTFTMSNIIDSIFDLKPVISDLQKQNDILGLGCTATITNLGIKEFCSKGAVMSSINGTNATQKWFDANSYVFGVGSQVATITEPTPIEYYEYDAENGVTSNKKVSSLRIGITAYAIGYVIGVGKQSYNIFGGANDVYVRLIGRSNFHSAAIGLSKKSARIFASYQEIEKYILKNKDVFDFMVKKHGYSFSVKPVSQEMLPPVSCKKAEKENAAKNRVTDLLNDINSINVVEDKIEVKEVTNDTMKQEALYRMEKLDMYAPVINGFKKGTIFMSEIGGIIYELDDAAKLAISSLKEICEEYLPYHVIKTGELYLVMYVSTDAKNWSCERVNAKGYIDECYTYNSITPVFSEFGSAKIVAANGGLVRVE